MNVELSLSSASAASASSIELGSLQLHHLQSIPTSDPDLRLTQLVPADDDTRKALDGLIP